MGFSQNTRGANKYGLVVTDVFTREVATKVLPDKRAETVTQAAAEIIPDLVQDEGNYVVTTDQGNEFQGLERALPGGVVHRQKDPSDRNATAVADRAIQTLKKDLAGMVARDSGGWGEHVENVTEAYNARPHEAVHAAPEDVETQPTTTFRVYQDNATKFQHNKELTEGRNGDWKKRAHSKLQPMQEEASNRSTDLLAMLPALIPWLFEPQMEPKLC